jgi:branched-chain amino acid transport system substrate-binding protein
LLANFSDTPAVDRLIFKLANVSYNAGDRLQARAYFERITSEFPQSRFYGAAKDALRRIGHQNVFDSKRIGVILTLSGKFGKFGYKALQGIELALKVFQAPSDSNQVSMVVMDDQGDPDRAIALMEELFYKYHVVAVLGPISSKVAEPLGKKAQELGLPLITLSQKEAQGGEFVFNAGLTPAMQVRDLVEYITDKMGMKNVALLSPASRFGDEYTKAFWDELDRMQVTVRGAETYPEDETDFRAYVDKLVGLAQTDARSHEVEELRALKNEVLSKGRQSKRNERVFDLAPVVDFDAVFIPDDPKVLGQVLPTFAYRDIEGVRFLGINTWNSQELLTRAGHFAEGSIFVDGFYAGSQKPSVQSFIDDYRRTFNAEPGLLEAIAFDAGHIVSSILSSSAKMSRTDLREQIAGLRSFPGVSGKIFYQNGRLNKQLHILTVKSGKIEEIAL